jgi:hypothetical protein
LQLQRTVGAAKTMSAKMTGKQALKAPAPKVAVKVAVKPVAPATKKV